MLMAKDGPLEKSTPEECRIALPLKLSAPDGSLGGGGDEVSKNDQ